MQEVRVGRFEIHYRLPQSRLAERRRLDQIRGVLLEEAFELALERAGLPQDGELCIRKIYAPIRLRLAGTDAAHAVDWSLALAEEIARELRMGRTSNMVFYHSRRQAVIDLAISAARDDLSRAWAWGQLGIWRAGQQSSGIEAIRELVRTLCAEPAMVAPALRALGEVELLDRLIRRMTGRQLMALASAALSEAGVANIADEADHAPTSRAMHDAMRVLNVSRLLRSVTSCGLLADETDEASRAIAALAVLEAEPALLRARAARGLIGAIACAIRSARNEAIVEPSDHDQAHTAEIDEQPEDRESLDHAGAMIRQHARRGKEESIVPDLRKRSFTRFGGLLFLLGVIEDLKLPDDILGHAALGLRQFQWVMHRLALRLVGATPDDAAALAFSGLPTEAQPPSDDSEVLNDDEEEAIEMIAEAIIEHLRAQLERGDEPARKSLEFVCHRRAEIIADPGWIDVKFSLDELSTEIRRAGLDLNPGYLPWLGVVVRFVYE
jgi:hypothetical protein